MKNCVLRITITHGVWGVSTKRCEKRAKTDTNQGNNEIDSKIPPPAGGNILSSQIAMIDHACGEPEIGKDHYELGKNHSNRYDSEIGRR